MHKSLVKTEKLPDVLAEKNQEKERMHDVFLLLQNLSNREEVTIKLIIDSLYDIASVNLINKKFSYGPLRKILKPISRMSKPAFRFFAWRWFLKNFPPLITKWLYKQVTFNTASKKKVQKPVTTIPQQNAQLEAATTANSTLELELANREKSREIKHLRSRIKWLTGVLIGIITIFSSGFLWLGYELEKSHSRTVEELKMQVKTLEAVVNK
ncbi:hypothetical protein [Mastigocoleus testarum]|uniref:Uncharacterized protein n=1 Tax=Mastigocoleus testarum BC008 TaxID=371196 RepID=A0A0V7ZTB6_9CYAN|nr:hypothetical protein [Mastigocoleus testarum]KST67908.1 hypothetical protein BC008_31485 [Mastigocoleus testarum BC008]